jgi:transposase
MTSEVMEPAEAEIPSEVDQVPDVWQKDRAAGAYLGLAPGKDQSDQSDPKQRISKHGVEMLRCLLVGSAHYVLGLFAQDSDLRRHGLKIVEHGAGR